MSNGLLPLLAVREPDDSIELGEFFSDPICPLTKYMKPLTIRNKGRISQRL
jgi:hypothetical protein